MLCRRGLASGAFTPAGLVRQGCGRLILEIHYLRVSLVIMPPTGGVIPAMPVERIIDPACVRTIRRSPKRMSPDPTNNSTNHRTRGPSDHETSPGTKRRPDGIRL